MRSPLRWVGGKGKLVNTILPLFPEHKGYVEVFGGSAVVLLNKPSSKWEVLNDFDSNLANFWKVIQRDKDKFLESFKYEIVSRERFQEYREKYKMSNYENDIEQAKIFYYIVRSSFGGDMYSPSFGASKDRNRLRLDRIRADIDNVYQRILPITVENRSFEKLIKTYDSEDTFFYLDPPYRNTKRYATGKFSDDQYELLKGLLAKSKGKWLLTINDDPYIRELFKDHYVMDHEVMYTISKERKNRVSYGELIITNYDTGVFEESTEYLCAVGSN